MHTSNHSRHDVVIVGGRVAGSATAMLLARLGHDVVVVDQASFPSDTVSTHSIARSGVVQLRRWGLLNAVVDSGAPAIRQVTFHARGESVSRPVKHKAGVGFVVAPRRYVLDTILAAAAERAGACVRPGVTVTGVQRDGRGRAVGVYGRDRAGAPIAIGARYIIGADGLRSRVARSSAPRSARSMRTARLSTRTTQAVLGPATSTSSLNGRSPECSRLTTGRHASGYAIPPPTRRRSAAGPRRERRLSASCSSVPPRSWPSGCATLAVSPRCRACSGCPTRYVRRSARAGLSSGTSAIAVTSAASQRDAFHDASSAVVLGGARFRRRGDHGIRARCSCRPGRRSRDDLASSPTISGQARRRGQAPSSAGHPEEMIPPARRTRRGCVRSRSGGCKLFTIAGQPLDAQRCLDAADS